MFGSEIYRDFSEDIRWIIDKIEEEIPLFPSSLKPLIKHYLGKRLYVLSGSSKSIKFDPELGRPVPYATFWFAEALGYKDKQATRKLALGMVYSSIFTTIRDDVLDKKPSSGHYHLILANMYLHKYYSIFFDLFSPYSKFWYYLANCISEQVKYDIWNLAANYDLSVDPFAESFLEESSRYFSAVVMPSLVALAIATDNEKKIPILSRFLRHFSMGWRVYDDLKDWHEDLNVDNLNHSSILIYTLQKMGGKFDLNEDAVMSMFLSPDFVRKTYSTILGFFKAAKKDVSPLNCTYLNRFMDEQISFHSRRRDELLRSSSDFYGQIRKVLNSQARASGFL